MQANQDASCTASYRNATLCTDEQAADGAAVGRLASRPAVHAGRALRAACARGHFAALRILQHGACVEQSEEPAAVTLTTVCRPESPACA
jgi:hypothetical protein